MEKEFPEFAVRPCERMCLKMGEESHPRDKTAEPQNNCNIKMWNNKWKNLMTKQSKSWALKMDWIDFPNSKFLYMWLQLMNTFRIFSADTYISLQLKELFKLATCCGRYRRVDTQIHKFLIMQRC